MAAKLFKRSKAKHKCLEHGSIFWSTQLRFHYDERKFKSEFCKFAGRSVFKFCNYRLPSSHSSCSYCQLSISSITPWTFYQITYRKVFLKLEVSYRNEKKINHQSIICYTTTQITWAQIRLETRGGVLEDVLGLEDTFWSPWSWPRSLKSSNIALSSARGQHYFFWTVVISLENARNLAENLQTPFCFPHLEHRRRQWKDGRASPQLKFHQWQKCDKKAYCFFSFSFFLAFFADNSITN